MSDSDGRKRAPFRRVAYGLLVMATAGMLAAGVGLVSDVRANREVSQQEAKDDCADPKNCSAESLQADIRSAVAAEDIVDLGIWQLGLGALGLVLLGLTLAATLAAVREANEATGAAREAVRVTEETAKLQLRPYVFHNSGRFLWLYDRADPERRRIIEWRIHIGFQNMGQTPASG